jgi:hypothetical protein
MSSNPPRTKGNFSNGNRDTFDPAKGYLGVRLQQGVPLLDRDWNELEDTRRHFERVLRKFYIGEGVPSGVDGFKVEALGVAANDFVINAGRCMVDGFDVANEADLAYTAQGLGALPVPGVATKYVVYLEVWVEAVTSLEDPDLRNGQDINLETSIRDQLRWQVKVAPWPLVPGARSSYVLASIQRPANATVITAPMITDLRRLRLTLADVVDLGADLKPRVEALEAAVGAIQGALTGINQQLGRLFWDVDMQPAKSSAYFGESVPITVTVANALGPVAGVRVEFSADYGHVTPASAVTNGAGKATTTLYGVEADEPPDENDLPILHGIALKVSASTRSDKTVNYSQMKFAPQEMAVMSKYSPAATFADIERNIAVINPLPPSRPAMVTCYAKQSGGTIVRGIGTVQVTFSQWVRGWVLTKVKDVASQVEVGSRVGSKFGAAWNATTKDLNADAVKNGLLDEYANIAAETQDQIVVNLFQGDPQPDELGMSGLLGQAIASAVTNQVGKKTNQAVGTQMAELQSQGLAADKASTYRKGISQTANQAQAGMQQGHMITFGGGMAFGG